MRPDLSSVHGYLKLRTVQNRKLKPFVLLIAIASAKLDQLGYANIFQVKCVVKSKGINQLLW